MQEGVWVLAVVGAIGIAAIVVLTMAYSDFGSARRRSRAPSGSSTTQRQPHTSGSVGRQKQSFDGQEQRDVAGKNLTIPPPDEARIEAVAPRNERPRRIA